MTAQELFDWLLENQLRATTDTEAYQAELEVALGQIDWASQSDQDVNNILGLAQGITLANNMDLPTYIQEQINEEVSLRDLDSNDDRVIDDTEAAEAVATVESGGEEAGEAAQSLEGADENSFESEYPRWALEAFGREPTDDEVEELLNTVNSRRLAQGQQPFSSLDDIPDPYGTQVVEELAGIISPEEEEVWEPFTKLSLRHGKDLEMKTDVLNQALELTGFDERTFGMTVQLADSLGLRRANSGELTFSDPRLGGVEMSVPDGGDIAWQVLPALMNMTGHRPTGGSAEERAAALRRLRSIRNSIRNFEEGVGRPRQGDPGYSTYIRLQEQYEVALREYNLSAPSTTRPNADGDLTNLNLQGVVNRFEDGTRMYGGLETMGLLHAVDPALARSLWQTNGDYTLVTEEQIDKTGYWLSKMMPGAGSAADAFSAGLVQMGYGEAGGMDAVMDIAKQIDFVRNGPDTSGGAGSQRIRMIPDRDALEQATKDMLTNLYPEEVPDAEVKRIVDDVVAQAMGAPMDQSVDLAAKVRTQVEQNELYDKYYGAKPAGIDEGVYRGTMERGAASMLGNEAALTSAAGLGMQSGNYQTAVGAAAGTSAAWDNSTFLGRLAEAANVMSRNT